MTAKLLWEAVLIELNKVNAPSLLLEDFNYLANKAVNQYINKKYNTYDVNQQSTDDLRVLKATAILDVLSCASKYSCGNDLSTNTFNSSENRNVTLMNSLYGATYEVDLPDDYLHMLNCVCVYKVNKTFKCYDKDTYVLFGAKRLTADVWGEVINNFYMKPSYKLPYYYIHHVNTNNTLPTNPVIYNEPNNINSGIKSGTDVNNINTTPETTPTTPTTPPVITSNFVKYHFGEKNEDITEDTIDAWPLKTLPSSISPSLNVPCVYLAILKEKDISVKDNLDYPYNDNTIAYKNIGKYKLLSLTNTSSFWGTGNIFRMS